MGTVASSTPTELVRRCVGFVPTADESPVYGSESFVAVTCCEERGVGRQRIGIVGYRIGIVLDVPTGGRRLPRRKERPEIVRGLTCVFGVFGSRAPCGAGVCIWAASFRSADRARPRCAPV